MASFRFSEFNHPAPNWVEKPYKLRLPFSNGSEASAPRVLFVVEHVSDDDLRDGRLLGTATGDFLQALLERACREAKLGSRSFTWAAINWNCWKTYGETSQFQAQSQEEFKQRVHAFAKKFQPTHVIVFGWNAAKRLLEKQAAGGYFEYNIFGLPFATKLGGHIVRLTTTIPLHLPVEDDHPKGHGPSNLCGYMVRNITNGLLGRNLFRAELPKFNIVNVDTIKAFDAMLETLWDAPYVSIDTETDSLNRRAVKMLTSQFSCSEDTAYFLPFLHRKAPWDKKQRAYISKKLTAFYEENNNRYHIYHNAKFDVNVSRSNTGFCYYKAPVWDLMNAEFCFHPNTVLVTENGRMSMRDFIALPTMPRVLTFNHETGETEYKSVIGTSEHTTDQDMYEIEYDGGVLRVTADHKVWSVTRNSYIMAKDLTEDDELLVHDESVPHP